MHVVRSIFYDYVDLNISYVSINYFLALLNHPKKAKIDRYITGWHNRWKFIIDFTLFQPYSILKIIRDTISILYHIYVEYVEYVECAYISVKKGLTVKGHPLTLEHFNKLGKTISMKTEPNVPDKYRQASTTKFFMPRTGFNPVASCRSTDILS